MPSYSDRTRYEFGDEVSNGVSSGIVEWSKFKNSDTGKHFLVVWIKEGTHVGQRPKVRYPWVPILDHDGAKTFRLTCETCRRTFWAPARFEECRTCSKATAERERRQERDYAADTGDNRRTRDGRVTLPKWGPERVCPGACPNATEEQRESLDRHRVNGDDDSPY